MDPKSQVMPPFSHAFLPLLDTLPFFAPDAGAMRHKPLCHSRSQRVACAQALLFGRAKREARTRELTARGRVSSRVPLARLLFNIPSLLPGYIQESSFVDSSVSCDLSRLCAVVSFSAPFTVIALWVEKTFIFLI